MWILFYFLFFFLVYRNLVLKNKFTFELLFFVWKSFYLNKKSKFSTLYLGKNKITKSISCIWLKKVLYLIYKGKFKYSILFNKSYQIQKNNLKLLKLCILETSFLVILKPLFFDYLSFNYLNLKECLRLLDSFWIYFWLMNSIC